MADVSQMTDEEINKVIETGVEPDETPEPVEAPSEPAEEQPAEAPAEEPAEVEEEPAEEAAPEEKPPSRREQLRIQQLLAKYGDPSQRQAPPQPSQPNAALDYNTALDADPEVIAQLEADRKRAGQASRDEGYSEGLRKAEAIEFRTNIRLDLPLVAEKLQKLDPRDAEALDKEYLYTVGFDPATGYVQNMNIGYAEFIDARIDQAERLASAMNAQTVKNIAKQSAQTGLRPDGSSAKRLNLNQPAQNMTMEELYAAIGQTPPKQ